ncbi:MAG: hypothetical protein HRT71_03275 [Flavobacteriales bacterium]|nr:hypothetical protein [Flavobacteriales bacterium]
MSYQGNAQKYLRNRISKIVHKNYGTSAGGGPEVTTYFSYDPHGNVQWVVQELPGIGQATVEYQYDLLTSNVKEVILNKGRVDEFYHRYEYDQENRITCARVSSDGIVWDKDVTYNYYKHGPLERAELGEDLVQATDYIYTIRGWLKGINSPDVKAYNSTDLKDGAGNILDGENNGFSPDEFSFVVQYFEGDFSRNSSTVTSTTTNEYYLQGSTDLFNGNIAALTSSIEEEVGNSAYFSNNGWTNANTGHMFTYASSSNNLQFT